MDTKSKETWITLQQQIFENAAMMLHWSFSTKNVVINRLHSHIQMDNTTFAPM